MRAVNHHPIPPPWWGRLLIQRHGANQPISPPGTSTERVDWGRCARVLYNFTIWLRNIFYCQQQFIIICIMLLIPTRPQNDGITSPTLSSSMEHPLITWLTSIYFWLVVAFTIITWRPSKVKLYFILINFSSFKLLPEPMGQLTHIRSSPRAPPLQPSHYLLDHQLLAGCCVFSLSSTI